MIGTVQKPFTDIQGRKYIDLKVESTVLHVKVPFRYGRVMGCTVHGHIPIQDFVVDQKVEFTIIKKKWDNLEYYVLESIKPC